MPATSWTDVATWTTGSGLEWTHGRLHRCDPYLVWADATTHAVAPRMPPEDEGVAMPDIGVLVEMRQASDFDALRKHLAKLPGTDAEPHFWPGGIEGLRKTRFVTGFVTSAGLKALVDLVAGVATLEKGAAVLRFTLQESRRGPEGPRREELDSVLSGGASPSPAGEDADKAPANSGTYLGIVDDGLPFHRLHDLVDRPGRAVCMWDQGWERWGATAKKPESLAQATPRGAVAKAPKSPARPHSWRPAWDHPDSARPRGFFYGRRLDALPSASGALRRNASSVYAESAYYSTPPRQTHGASVLGLMAPWTSTARGPVAFPEHISGLAMVQLPTNTVDDTSGGSLAARALDALRYILWQETQGRAADSAPRRIVANISYGVHAGPHDGTSLFERALLELLDEHEHLHVVLPAGNSGRIGCHARRELAGEIGASQTLQLRVLPDNRSDSFIEFWMPEGSDVELTVQYPGATAHCTVRRGQAMVRERPSSGPGEKAASTIVFGAIYPHEVAQGTNGTMLLLAIGATWRVPHETGGCVHGFKQHERSTVCAPPGLWTLTLTNRKAEATVVNAWVERGDAAPDRSAGGRQAYFPDSCMPEARRNNATAEGTLNGLATATHDRLHVVGAMRTDGVLSDYTAAGPARGPATRQAPDAVAPADWSRALPGLRTTGFAEGAVVRVNGTSAACAVYARALAEQLARDPTTPPSAPVPRDAPPEKDCTPESQPIADQKSRGQAVRGLYPFGGQ